MFDALAADKNVADIVGAEQHIEVGPLETIRAKIDHDRLVGIWTQRVDNVDLPGADDALVLVLRSLKQGVVLVLRQFREARTPTDVDENREQATVARRREHALRVRNRVVLLNLSAEVSAPNALRIADAVLPVQHQQRGLGRHPPRHDLPFSDSGYRI